MNKNNLALFLGLFSLVATSICATAPGVTLDVHKMDEQSATNLMVTQKTLDLLKKNDLENFKIEGKTAHTRSMGAAYTEKFKMVDLPKRFQPLQTRVTNNTKAPITIDRTTYLGRGLSKQLAKRKDILDLYPGYFKSKRNSNYRLFAIFFSLGILGTAGGALTDNLRLFLTAPFISLISFTFIVASALHGKTHSKLTAGQKSIKKMVPTLTDADGTTHVVTNKNVTIKPGQVFAETVFISTPSLELPMQIVDNANLVYETQS